MIKKVTQKCIDNDFFTTLVPDEDDMKNFIKACSDDELDRLEALDMETGYNAEDPNDKFDYFKHLPRPMMRDMIAENLPSLKASVDNKFISKLQKSIDRKSADSLNRKFLIKNLRTTF